MKKVLAISSVLFGVVFLAGCGQQPVSQTQPTTAEPVVQTPTQPVTTQPVPASETANWQTYTSAKSAFSISVPKDWTYTEQMPTPFVATEFFGDSNKSTRLLLVDRFETNGQANADTVKDLMAWAKEDMAIDRSANSYKDPGCKDGTAQLAIRDDNYKAVIIDCPKRDTESYVLFTQDRHYLMESPLKYKNANVNIYNNIYKSFKVN